MDVHMIRQAEPAEKLLNQDNADSNALSQLTINVSSLMTESVSLDNSAMLTSVINEVHDTSANSITFDAKRDDGTIGYRSSLATIDTYGAMSNVGSDSIGSIKRLIENDIMPVARICCYKDNVLPSHNKDLAVKKGKKLYTDRNSAIDKQIKNLDKLGNNQIYYISTELDTTRVYEHLISSGIERFIIAD